MLYSQCFIYYSEQKMSYRYRKNWWYKALGSEIAQIENNTDLSLNIEKGFFIAF